MEHVQLVPQSRGVIDEGLCSYLKEKHPKTRFRLHANARVQFVHRIIDLSEFAEDRGKQWFMDAARVSKMLHAPAYSAHSGRRENASLKDVFYAAQCLADWFDCPVAIEGQYPTKDGSLLIDSWDEYRELFESGVPYALDLSHINILAKLSGEKDIPLLQEMLASENCIEIHVSDNDGSRDQHRICERKPWWHDLLMRYANPGAVVFSEGNHKRERASLAH